ncbi:DNA-binding protein [Pedobacter frigidisoli]|uniref:DNA-binding protein n=1 Tax=Pedobacter frigidisoli TaxID=2530455 RepID=A0A4R0P2J7_9SPHI|nr:helix-turn-helix domain-containing protein [Pedobacter frigidisoli]TCD11034.1 DNA-binding protein [Pedobacter frigidisoli]
MLNIQQASHLLTLSVNTIYSKVSKKQIPYYKQGKRPYFSKPILIKWIETGHQLTEMEIQTDTEIQFIEKQKRKAKRSF